MITSDNWKHEQTIQIIWQKGNENLLDLLKVKLKSTGFNKTEYIEVSHLVYRLQKKETHPK